MKNLKFIHHYSKTCTSSPLESTSYISLEQLQNKILNEKKNKKNHQNQTPIKQQNQNQHQGFYTSRSPFYKRIKIHKQGCKCPYHKKIQISPIKIQKKQKKDLSQQKINHKGLTERITRSANKENQYTKRFLKRVNYTPQIPHQPQNCKINESNHKISSKINSRNQQFEYFLQKFKLFILSKDPSNPFSELRLIKKSIFEIFNFIKNNMELSEQQMLSKINNIEKDKNYTQFYVERFKQLKQRDQKKRLDKQKQQEEKKIKSLRKMEYESNKLDKNSHNKSNSKLSQSSKRLLQLNQEANKSNKNFKNIVGSKRSSRKKMLNLDDIDIDDLISCLRKSQPIPSEVINKIMRSSLSSFKNIFGKLNKNIKNSIYEDDLMKKFKNYFIDQLLQSISNTNQEENNNYQQKLSIITQTDSFIKFYFDSKNQNRKSNQSLHNHQNNFNQSHFHKKRNSSRPHHNNASLVKSKKSTLRNNFSDDQQNTKDLQDQEVDEINENLIDLSNKDKNLQDQLNQRNNKKSFMKLSRASRRSKITRDSLQKIKQNLEEEEKDQYQFNNDIQENLSRKYTNLIRRGNLIKGQNYLHDIKMGAVIVKIQDSAFTIKRKIRVVKDLIKETTKGIKVNVLKDYIEVVEDDCSQKMKQKGEKVFQNKIKKRRSLNYNNYLQEQEVFFQQCMTELDLNIKQHKLVFYHLRTDFIRIFDDFDDQDQCYLLHRMKLKKQSSFSTHKRKTYISQQKEIGKQNDLQFKKKYSNQNQGLIQKGFNNIFNHQKVRNYLYENIQDQNSQKNQSNKNQQSTFDKTFLGLNDILNFSNGWIFESKTSPVSPRKTHSKQNSTINNFDINSCSKKQERTKKLMMFVKNKLPQTFDQFYKTSSKFKKTQKKQFVKSQYVQ